LKSLGVLIVSQPNSAKMEAWLKKLFKNHAKARNGR